ncbi:hypothetical protein [Glycomyces sp. NPDC048151]|uniref:hypothetical protein n=1 Tax=Glycomyces sp. NPDC048151 TaxID=3364002 RepID=UPI003714215D
MSSGHDNSGQLQDFQGAIRATVRELEDDPEYPMSRTAIAKAGGLSRNQLYAWMGKGSQGIKQVPPKERVVRFYKGVRKSWRPIFEKLGWSVVGEFAEPPPAPEPAPLSGIDRRIDLLWLAINRPGIKPEERRELETQMVRLQVAKQMSDDALASADKALKRHGAA